MIKRLALICLLLPGTANVFAEEPDRLTLYFRGDLREDSSNIVTLNGLHDLVYSWGEFEYAARVGLIDGKHALWSYKLEALSRRFLDNHRVAVRLVKNNYHQERASQDTRLAERIIGSYPPFSDAGILDPIQIDIELGVAQNFMGGHGSNVLPNGKGALNVVPMYALRVQVPVEQDTRAYIFTFADFDIFDPYPATQPFVQAEVTQKIETTKLFAYVRYRWDYAAADFYGLYLSIGAEFPN